MNAIHLRPVLPKLQLELTPADLWPGVKPFLLAVKHGLRHAVLPGVLLAGIAGDAHAVAQRAAYTPPAAGEHAAVDALCPLPNVATHTVVARASRRHNGATEPDVIRAVCSASRKAQSDPYLLLAIAWQESRFDPAARNRHSSARGLLQFTNATWLAVIRDFGARYGLADLAASIRSDDEGRLVVESRALRKRILALRDDPEIEAIMAAEWLGQEKVALESDMHRSATPADLYLLHLLGPGGARLFLRSLARSPAIPSIDVVGHAAAVNRSLFVRHGRWLTVAESYRGIQDSLREQIEQRTASIGRSG